MDECVQDGAIELQIFIVNIQDWPYVFGRYMNSIDKALESTLALDNKRPKKLQG